MLNFAGMDLEKEDKAALRRALLKERRAYGRNEAFDARIAQRVLALPQWDSARSVFLYLPLSWEVGTQALLTAAFAQGKRVCVPVCREGGEMDAVQVTPESEYAVSSLGISEPRGGEILPADGIDLLLVPALAFDRAGFRLGRGGGYYDRFLAASRGVKLGLAYTPFVFDALPRQAHDLPVDAICTQEDLTWIKK